VLGLPAGELTLDRQLNISRPRTVLRGEGAAATTLRLTRSLTDLKGPSNYSEGFWVYSGGLLQWLQAFLEDLEPSDRSIWSCSGRRTV